MFPRGILYVLLIFLVDLVLKSLKDKKEIEEGREKRKKDITIEIGPVIEAKKEAAKAREERSKPSLEASKPRVTSLEERKIAQVESWEISSMMEEEIGEEAEGEGKKRKRKHPLMKNKEDILKGIIYSEILAKPKSLRR